MIITILSCAAIIGTLLFFIFQIEQFKKKGLLIEKRRYVEQRPSVVSTLGVLFTFLGITIGLCYFNTQDINASIPKLLDGLKTAFFTSLTGMIGSLILNKRVDTYYDELDTKEKKEFEKNKVTDIELAAGLVVKAVESMSQQSKSDSESIRRAIEGMVKENTQYQSKCLDFYEKTINNQNGNSIKIENGFKSIESKTDELLSVLHKEVDDIEKKMTETNKLLTSKFDEFSELLKKSNTEALVEVMGRVTDEFQKQMNELIGRLVKENFEKLNSSVQQLNTWQLENKEMVGSLVAQYKEMATQFSETGTTLDKVAEGTKLLVSDGGKLQAIVGALNDVMVNDEKFVQITSNMSTTAELAKENMEIFNESTNKLNDWVRKQRNFVDAVQELIAKLEQISKLKDYSEEFWKGQKIGMAESIGTLKQGAQHLNAQLTELDQRFYNRLSATLAQLDACIQAMVNGRR